MKFHKFSTHHTSIFVQNSPQSSPPKQTFKTTSDRGGLKDGSCSPCQDGSIPAGFTLFRSSRREKNAVKDSDLRRYNPFYAHLVAPNTISFKQQINLVVIYNFHVESFSIRATFFVVKSDIIMTSAQSTVNSVRSVKVNFSQFPSLTFPDFYKNSYNSQKKIWKSKNYKFGIPEKLRFCRIHFCNNITYSLYKNMIYKLNGLIGHFHHNNYIFSSVYPNLANNMSMDSQK